MATNVIAFPIRNANEHHPDIVEARERIASIRVRLATCQQMLSWWERELAVLTGGRVEA